MRTSRTPLLSFVLLVAAEADALVIDDFSNVQSLELPLGSASVGQDSPGSMVGGERRITLHDTAVSSSASALVSGGSLHYSTSGAPGTDFAFVTWNAGDAVGAGLGGIDLTEGGRNDRFLIDLTAVSGPWASLWITVGDTSDELSRWLPAHYQPGVIVFKFDEFSANVFPTPADLTSIKTIKMKLQLQGEGSMTIGSMAAVPEPSTLLLVMCGLTLIRSRRWASRSG